MQLVPRGARSAVEKAYLDIELMHNALASPHCKLQVLWMGVRGAGGSGGGMVHWAGRREGQEGGGSMH